MKDDGVGGFRCWDEKWHLVKLVSSLNLTPYFTSFLFLRCKQITYTESSPKVPQGLCPTRFLLIIFSLCHRQQWHLC